MQKTIKIYQIPFKEENIELLFKSFNMISFSIKNYQKVYEYILSTNKVDKILLEEIFEKFNCNHPSDYLARSLSVSDVVEIDNKFFYCDSIGFVKIESL